MQRLGLRQIQKQNEEHESEVKAEELPEPASEAEQEPAEADWQYLNDYETQEQEPPARQPENREKEAEVEDDDEDYAVAPEPDERPDEPYRLADPEEVEPITHLVEFQEPEDFGDDEQDEQELDRGRDQRFRRFTWESPERYWGLGQPDAAA